MKWSRHRPAWWPEGEAWPPRRRWRRPRFLVWRALGFMLFMVLGVGAACIGLLWLLGLVGVTDDPGRLIAWAAIILGLGSTLVVLSSLRGMAEPLNELIDAASKLELGDFSTRIRPKGPRELRLLGRAFNDLAERLGRTEAQRKNLLADITHELRTPMAILQGNLEGMLDGIYPADESTLGSLLDEVRHVSHLIDDLQILSLAESGALELQREPTDLPVLIHDALATLQPQAEALGVALAADLPEDFPSLNLDSVRMREVLVNLLNNALAHTPNGGEVRVKARVDAQAVITVSDTGGGIDPDELPHIFDRFYKSAGSTGSGLGLTISKNLVEAHGGSIRAESSPGEGARLIITLPVDPRGAG